MNYFAYGSNMDPQQMIQRCPSAKFVTVARLPDYRLLFPRRSQSRGCGVASVEPSASENVWGVVFHIDANDAQRLDSAEGFRTGRPIEQNAYVRQLVRVMVQEAGGEVGQDVETYLANQQPDPPRPSSEYMNQIILGARHHRLPFEYVNYLERIEAKA